MSEAKQKLIELEKTGKYFFHGSENEVEVFEPRQSYDVINGNKREDGPPAIFASPSPEYGIFMSMIGKKNCPEGFSCSVIAHADAISSDNFTLTFHSTSKTIAQLNTGSSGWVYVFDRKDFPNRKGPGEYFSTIPVTPIEKVLVRKEDLPENIEIK